MRTRLTICDSMIDQDRNDFLSSAVIKYSALPKSSVFYRKTNDEETGTSHTHSLSLSLSHTFTRKSSHLAPLTWNKQLLVTDTIQSRGGRELMSFYMVHENQRRLWRRGLDCLLLAG